MSLLNANLDFNDRSMVFYPGDSFTVPSGEKWKITEVNNRDSYLIADINGVRCYRSNQINQTNYRGSSAPVFLSGGDTFTWTNSSDGGGLGAYLSIYDVSDYVTNDFVLKTSVEGSFTVPTGETWVMYGSGRGYGIYDVDGNSAAIRIGQEIVTGPFIFDEGTTVTPSNIDQGAAFYGLIL